MARPHLRSLDTLRGLAALCVALYHARTAIGAPGVLPHAYLCVDFFFVLSGLVVYRSYADAIASGMPASRFLWNRLARLGPLYLLATLLGLGLFVITQHAGHHPLPPGRVAAAAALNLFALPCPPGLSPRPDGALFPYLVPAWSIAWELALSVAFALWVKLGRRGLLVIAGVGGVLLLAGAFDRETIDFGWAADRPWIGGVRALLGFAMGSLCARSLQQASFSNAQRSALALVSVLCATAAALYICVPARANLPMELACALIVFPALTFCTAAADPSWLRSTAGDWLGRLSYACYMLHGALIDVSTAIANHVWLKASHAAQLGTGAILLIVSPGALWFMYTRFERPMQTAILSFGRDRETPNQSQSSYSGPAEPLQITADVSAVSMKAVL